MGVVQLNLWCIHGATTVDIEFNFDDMLPLCDT